MNTFQLFFKRECQLLLRNSSAVGQPLCLFVLIALLFPFSVPSDSLVSNGVLTQMGGSVIWVAVLLALMLSLEAMFKDDLRDGLIEQWLIGDRSMPLAVLGKVAAHWCTTGLTLVIMAPLVAVTYALPWELFQVLVVSLLLGTPTILLIGAIGAALTVTLERSGLLITVVTLPLTIPVLIFGASTLGSSAQGFSIATELYALAAIAVLALTLAPFAIAAALRLTIE